MSTGLESPHALAQTITSAKALADELLEHPEQGTTGAQEDNRQGLPIHVPFPGHKVSLHDPLLVGMLTECFALQLVPISGCIQVSRKVNPRQG